jgi:hypothetical protein
LAPQNISVDDASVSPSQSETTGFIGLTNFVNRGTLSLRDGGIGEVAHFIGNANFQAGSVQAIDSSTVPVSPTGSGRRQRIPQRSDDRRRSGITTCVSRLGRSAKA